MRGCATCMELEQLLEQTAQEYWNVIHQHRANQSSQRAPSDIAELLARAKDAMDEAQKTYHEHLGLAHSLHIEPPDAKS